MIVDQLFGNHERAQRSAGGLADPRRRREGWLAEAIDRDLSAREQRVLAEATALLRRLADGGSGRR
jgi:hypothetical protein